MRRQFAFVAYAAVYGYVGISTVLIRNMNSEPGILSYFVFTGSAMLVLLITIARRFGRERESLQRIHEEKRCALATC